MYAGNKGIKSRRETLGWFGRCGGAVPLWLAGCLAFVLLVAAGVVYRAQIARLEALPPISLPVPLKNMPLEINGWVGRSLEIPTTTDIYMRSHFADDYVSRRYTNSAEGMWADLYVVYCSSRLAGLSGHKPRVCYPGNGWNWDETTTSELVATSGRRTLCLVHRFHWPVPEEYREVVVLNFYVLNGVVTLDESEFSNLWGRRVNSAGDPTRYVAQVQVSAPTEQAARAALSSLADTVFAFLPSQEGNVQAGIVHD
jgi:hypothetical protein